MPRLGSFGDTKCMDIEHDICFDNSFWSVLKILYRQDIFYMDRRNIPELRLAVRLSRWVILYRSVFFRPMHRYFSKLAFTVQQMQFYHYDEVGYCTLLKSECIFLFMYVMGILPRPLERSPQNLALHVFCAHQVFFFITHSYVQFFVNLRLTQQVFFIIQCFAQKFSAKCGKLLFRKENSLHSRKEPSLVVLKNFIRDV